MNGMIFRKHLTAVETLKSSKTEIEIISSTEYFNPPEHKPFWYSFHNFNCMNSLLLQN